MARSPPCKPAGESGGWIPSEELGPPRSPSVLVLMPREGGFGKHTRQPTCGLFAPHSPGPGMSQRNRSWYQLIHCSKALTSPGDSSQTHIPSPAFSSLCAIPGFPGGWAVKNPPANAGDAGSKDPLEKEMATHSSILIWEIPWTEEPGVLQSIGLQKSRTWLSNSTATSNSLLLSAPSVGICPAGIRRQI